MDDEAAPAPYGDDGIRRAADHWNQRGETDRTRWWTNPQVHRHINKVVCGEALETPWAGFHRRIEELAPSGGYPRAISVACGHGGKELDLLAAGVVQHFELYEISEARAQAGVERAAALGLADRVTFHVADAMALRLPTDYDLVYWNNALHHMMDAYDGVRWSRDRLRDGGVFAMDDFVGASRFQWPDAQLQIMRRVREGLPERFLVNPKDRSRQLPVKMKRPDEAALIRRDPTEAADSARILDAVRSSFASARVIRTGGVVYNTALMDAIANFADEGPDTELLAQLLTMDEALARLGETQYAVAVARKERGGGLPRAKRAVRRLVKRR